MRPPKNHRKRTGAGLLAALAVSACVAPDVSDDIKALSAFATETNTVLSKDLKAAADDDLRAAQQRRIAARQPAFKLVGCENTDTFGLTPDCTFKSLAVLTAEGAVLQALDALDGYLQELTILASSQSVDAINTATAKLNTALSAAEGSDIAALAQLGSQGAKRRSAAAEGIGYLANQMRLQKLGQVIAKGNKIIPDMMRVAAANISADEALFTLRSDMLTLQGEAEDALNTGKDALYLIKLDAVKAAQTALMKAEAASPSNRLRLIAEMHNALAIKFRTGGTLEDVHNALQEIEAVSKAYKEAKA